MASFGYGERFGAPHSRCALVSLSHTNDCGSRLPTRPPTMTLVGGRVGKRDPQSLVCDNETNAQRLWGAPNRSPYPKDAIGDAVVDGGAVNPLGVGTKAALRYDLHVPA